jgi:DNA-binding NarL/FixJ family response regulator
MPSCTVLVIEDVLPFRQWVCSTLQEMPELQVIGEANDGLEAVQKAEELKPDLVILDIGLPKSNGIEVCRSIRKGAPESKILFLTAQSDPDLVVAALDAGASGYVHKALAANELEPAVAAVLGGKQFFSRTLKVPVFDIFFGVPDKNAVWIETAAGLSNARERMEAIAAQEPGQYFVFSRRDHTILAKTETRKKIGAALDSKTGVA